MAEPFSVLAQARIKRAALLAYLDSPPRSARRWNDWERIGGEWHSFDWQSDLERTLAAADQSLTGCYRDVIAAMIASEPDVPGCERCSYDEAGELFTFATLMFSHSVEDLVLFFAAARGLADFLHGAGAGFAVVQDHLWSAPPWTAVLEIVPGRSAFLDVRADAASYARCVGAAVAVLEDIKQAGGEADRVANEIDSLR